MKEKNIYYVLGGIAIVALITVAAYFSSGMLFKGEFVPVAFKAPELPVPTNVPPPPDAELMALKERLEEKISGQTNCGGFDDIIQTDPDCDAIDHVQDIGAMTGIDGNFAPNLPLKRDAITKIVLKTFSLFEEGTKYCQGNPFPDLTSSDWSYEYVCRGKAIGAITGYPDNTFRPSQNVNRIEFLALLLRNVSDPIPGNDRVSYLDTEVGAWYSGYAKYSQDNGLFEGTNLLPEKSTTRREVAKIIYKLQKAGKI